VIGNVHDTAGSLVERVEHLSGGIDDSTARLCKYSDVLEGGAAVVTSSSEHLPRSSESLSDANRVCRRQTLGGRCDNPLTHTSIEAHSTNTVLGGMDKRPK